MIKLKFLSVNVMHVLYSNHVIVSFQVDKCSCHILPKFL